MKSPFPGMDPYLEQHWEDVHLRLIGSVRDTVQVSLADDLVARITEKTHKNDQANQRDWEIEASAPQSYVDGEQLFPGNVAVATLDEPVMLEPLDDPIKHRAILIHDTVNNLLVTAIEILSPWNKTPASAVEQYLQKREQYLGGKVNLVEIDLVRAGDWKQMIGEFYVPANLRTTYRVTVVQPGKRGPLYPISLQSKLPRINVPLRPQDTPAVLDLQELIEKAYTMGRYGRVDYTQPCKPPLAGPEKEWAGEVLRARPAPQRDSR